MEAVFSRKDQEPIWGKYLEWFLITQQGVIKDPGQGPGWKSCIT